jgi:RNA polymerase sigma factor (sigma-70 family)
MIMSVPIDESCYSITKFQAGDPWQYHYVHQLFSADLCNFSFKIVQDWLAAEDIVAEVYLKLWHKRSRFAALTHVKAFLFISVKNASINCQRNQKRRAVLRTLLLHHCSTADNDIALNRMIQLEIWRQVQEAIKRLTPRRQEVCHMLYTEGKSARQVAKELNLSIPTINNHRTHIIEFLRAAMSIKRHRH